MDMKRIPLFFLFIFFKFSCQFAGGRPPVITGNFNVKKFGARANGRSDDSTAFLECWKAACGSSGVVNLIIPPGTYLLGQTKFTGPCNNVRSITVHLQGTLKATTDLNKYGSASWLEFGWINGLTLMGRGVIDGQGAASWSFNRCPKEKNCKVLPTNVLFVNTVNTVVTGITSLNSKFFHIGILGCKNFKGSNIKIKAPGNSPNTDGVHMERSSDVTLAGLTIETGDDCVSIGHGCSDVTISSIRCGPGHGISVGSLGRYKGEKDVTGVIVKNSMITGTTNGLRIKTWQNSPSFSAATNMTFDNIIMNNVGKPILIDQQYCPYAKCDASAPSRVKISNIKYKNIRGTSSDLQAVTLSCSKKMPCKEVSLQDVRLKYISKSLNSLTPKKSLTSSCFNVKPTFSGVQHPPPCH